MAHTRYMMHKQGYPLSYAIEAGKPPPPQPTHTHTHNTHTHALTHIRAHIHVGKYVMLDVFWRPQCFREYSSVLRCRYSVCLVLYPNKYFLQLKLKAFVLLCNALFKELLERRKQTLRNYHHFRAQQTNTHRLEQETVAKYFRQLLKRA